MDAEPEFLEGNANDVILEKIQLNEKDISMILEAGYNIGEIKCSKGIAMPLDDMEPIELELQDEEGHPDDVEVFGDEAANDVGNKPTNDVEAEAGNEAAAEGVDEGQEETNEGVNNLPVYRKRIPYERVLKIKLKNPVYDKDGSGSSATKPVSLE
ncbi:unnamed protein product [Lactuca virosa]|uniref:Uncharacterized protein n=1 Tax=Lactuca virosa TaxID=75947 RepID=A0AAU9P2G6_9ASTR|nr:unnamed protein product [Lactuca virosa]